MNCLLQAVTNDEAELIWKESIVKTEVQILELFEESIEPITRLLLTTVADSLVHTSQADKLSMKEPVPNCSVVAY